MCVYKVQFKWYINVDTVVKYPIALRMSSHNCIYIPCACIIVSNEVRMDFIHFANIEVQMYFFFLPPYICNPV